MTTRDVLSLAYAAVFGIESTQRGQLDGHFYGQRAGECEIDYANFDHPQNFDIGEDYIEAVTEDGSEGCWIRLERVHYERDEGYQRFRVGTVKTLCEGRKAWRDMGALAGELAYLANNDIAWELYKAERGKEVERHEV